MKVRMWVMPKVSVDPADSWEETVDTNETRCLADAPEGLTAEQYGQLVIDFFNSTLREGEAPRKLVTAEEL